MPNNDVILRLTNPFDFYLCGCIFISVGLASEGVSSGYESMRCESSNNLNVVSDLDSERGKPKTLKKDKKGWIFILFMGLITRMKELIKD